jgi:hypothetical protein
MLIAGCAYMSRNSDNRKRLFADIVTIDAWHDSFDGSRSSVDLHADVVFGTARIGGELDAPVRFRLSIKRAEVVVVIPESEPLSVDRSSVSRDGPKQAGRVTESFSKEVSAAAKGRIAASVGSPGINCSGGIDSEVKADVSSLKKLEVSREFQLMIVTSSKTGEGHYRWIVESGTGETLQGRPWDAKEQPRLKLIDRRKDGSRSIPPVVRVEVRCRSEDLLIEDLRVKDESLWDSVQSRFGFMNRMAAAKSYISKCLCDEGLEVNNIEDVFGCITLGSVTADSM